MATGTKRADCSLRTLSLPLLFVSLAWVATAGKGSAGWVATAGKGSAGWVAAAGKGSAGWVKSSGMGSAGWVKARLAASEREELGGDVDPSMDAGADVPSDNGWLVSEEVDAVCRFFLAQYIANAAFFPLTFASASASRVFSKSSNMELSPPLLPPLDARELKDTVWGVGQIGKRQCVIILVAKRIKFRKW